MDVIGAKSCEQGLEALAIFVGYGDEAQAEATAAFDMADNGIGLDSAFLNEKVELGGHSCFDFEVKGLNEQAVDTDVEDARDVVAAIAAPADPDVL
jgi:hypothetical protein